MLPRSCQLSVYSTHTHSVCVSSVLILRAQSRPVTGGKDRAHNCSIYGYSRHTQEIFTSFHFGATVFIHCACTRREKAGTASCYMKCRSGFCLHFKLLHRGGTLAGRQYKMSIFLSDLRLLRRTLEHCVWSKQYIYKSLALFSCWVGTFVCVQVLFFKSQGNNKSKRIFAAFSLDFWIIGTLIYFPPV